MNKEYTQAVQDLLEHYNKYGQISEQLINNLEHQHTQLVLKSVPLKSDNSGLSEKEKNEIVYLMHMYAFSFDDAKEVLQYFTTLQHNDDV